MSYKYLAGKQLVGLPYKRNGKGDKFILAKCTCGSIIEYKYSYLIYLENKGKNLGCRLCNKNRKSQLNNIKDISKGFLIAKEYIGNNLWKILCKCGKFCYMTSNHFLAGKRKSCGCIRKKIL